MPSIEYKFYTSQSKTVFDKFDDTVFIKATKNGETIKKIELYGFINTASGKAVEAPNLVIPIGLENPFESLHNGEDVFLTKEQVSFFVGQVNQKTIFSKVYKSDY